MTDTLLAHDHSELDAALAAAFIALAAGDIEPSFHQLDIFWARLAMHIRAENLHLFPALLHAAERPKQSSSVPSLKAIRSVIAQLRDDHDFFMSEITAAVRQLRGLRRVDHQDSSRILAAVSEQMVRVSQRLETYNALEESQVYHWAGTLLDEAEQKALSESIQRELDHFPPRLRKTESTQCNTMQHDVRKRRHE